MTLLNKTEKIYTLPQDFACGEPDIKRVENPTLSSHKEVFCSCNFNHSNLLRVIYSLLEVFTPQIIIWWGQNCCGVTQMQISTLNFS